MTDTAKLSEERLREILAGCEGVTPGPWAWEFHGDDNTCGVGQLVAFLDETDTPLTGQQTTGDALVVEAVAPEVAGAANAAHLARLDPQTVSALVTELLESRAAQTQPEAGEVGVEDDEYSDLCFRLLGRQRRPGSELTDPLCEEAAEAIQDLSRRGASLTAKLDEANAGSDACEQQYQARTDELLREMSRAEAAESAKASLIERVDALQKELNETREVCSLVRRQDYFDVPTPVLVEAQIQSAIYQALSDRLPQIDGVLKRYRAALGEQP